MYCEIKTCIKQTIKKNYNGIHDATEFENIIKELNQLIKPQYPIVKIKTIKKILSKYSYCDKAYIIIDTKNATYNTYDDISKKINNIIFVIKPVKKTHSIFGPYSDTWIHDVQTNDDVSSPELQRRINIFRYLENIEYPAQRSPAWYAARDQKITASDIGLCLGDDHYNEPYYAIFKKLRETFANNPNTYHGKKMEEIATLI